MVITETKLPVFKNNGLSLPMLSYAGTIAAAEMFGGGRKGRHLDATAPT
jgi:hypothetical protein